MKLAVIFDMDGVLIDSVPLNWQAYNQVLARYGAHIGDDELYRYVGRNTAEQVEMINHEFGLNIQLESYERESEAIKKQLFKQISPKPGVQELLADLQAAGVPMAVGTSTGRKMAEERLEAAGIRDYFDLVVTAEDVTAHKPDPAVYLKAAERLVADPAQCVVIEDAPVGIEAAHTAGMKAVAVRTSYVGDGHLASADLVVWSLEELNVKKLAVLL